MKSREKIKKGIVELKKLKGKVGVNHGDILFKLIEELVVE